MLLFICTLLVFSDSEWRIADTEIYQGIRPNEVAVTSSGDVYMLHFDEAHIKHFNAEGKLVKTIGRKGKGPGEFTFPIRFALSGERLFILDALTREVSSFDLEGKFLGRYKTGGFEVELQRVYNGWLIGDWNKLFEEEPADLVWVDDTFKNETKIADIKEIGWSQGSWVHTEDGEGVASYSPINNRPILVVSHDGKRAYLSEVDKFLIHIIDLEQKKIVGQITHESPRIPFDLEWAENKFKEDKGEQLMKFKLTKHYPEFFPIIRDMKMDPNGNLVVDRWRGRPDKKHHTIAFTPAGNVVESKFDWNALDRLIGTANGYAYVALYDEEREEGGIGRCKLENLNAYIEDHPYPDDIPFTRSISISD